MARPLAVVNADIRTSDPANPRQEAMLVERGRIAAVGAEAKILARARRVGARVLDVRGRTVTPGIIDSHTHLIHQGLLRRRLDLRGTTSLESALRRVRRSLRHHPKGEVLLAERWDESRWKEKRYPHRSDLDAISATVPIILRRVDGHVAVGNAAACRLLEGRTPGVNADSGLLVEEASLNLNQLFPTPVATTREALRLAQRQALRLGVTTVHDFVVPNYLRAYGDLRRRGELVLRAHLSLYVEYLDGLERTGFSRGCGDDRLRLAGVKLFTDGSLGGHTAALRRPYRDEGGLGRLNWTDDALKGIFRRAHDMDLQVSAHAIGDAAIDQVARSYASLGRAVRARRHRIEHFELHTPETVEAARRLGLVLSMQPNFVGEWSRPGGLYHRRLGPTRFRRNNQFRRLLSGGIHLAFGSDCMPFDPWFGIESCLTAPYAAQRLSLDQALAAYTRGSAWGLHREKDLGVLRAGAHADFLVLDLDPQRPSRTRVRRTFVGGRPAAEG